MESWRTVFRRGFAPGLSDRGLQAARLALECDDPRILQNANTSPPPLMCVQDWPIEGADFIGFCGWKGEPELATVGQVEEAFARACYDADKRLGEPAACRWFLNWYDEAPRDEMRRELLLEIDAELERRARERAPSRAAVVDTAAKSGRTSPVEPWERGLGRGQSAVKVRETGSTRPPVFHHPCGG